MLFLETNLCFSFYLSIYLHSLTARWFVYVCFVVTVFSSFAMMLHVLLLLLLWMFVCLGLGAFRTLNFMVHLLPWKQTGSTIEFKDAHFPF